VISGTVTADGTPIVNLHIIGRSWVAIVDSGFNGDVELPEAPRQPLNAQFAQIIISNLAGGQQVVESAYWVEFPFDGRTVTAVATFVPGEEILLGTGLLREHRLEIDFPASTVLIERKPTRRD
jgi:predicted aspartyl protease